MSEIWMVTNLSMSEFYEKYLLCDFFVRSKSYTFLESLGYCKKKKLDMLSNFFSDILRIFRARIWWCQVLCSVKNQTCLHVTFSNRKIIQYWSLFTKRLGCLLFLFLSYGAGTKYDDVITYSSSKMKLYKMWHIYQSKDNSVLIIFLQRDMGVCLVLELGGLNLKMMTYPVTF